MESIALACLILYPLVLAVGASAGQPISESVIEERRGAYVDLSRALADREGLAPAERVQVMGRLESSHRKFAPAVTAYLREAQAAQLLDSALSIYESRLRLSPRDPWSLLGLEVARFRAGDCEGALVAGKQAQSLGCGAWECYAYLAYSFKCVGRADEGESFFDGIIERSKEGEVAGWSYLGKYLLLTGTSRPVADYEALLERATSLLREGAGREAALHFWGELLLAGGRYEEAEAKLSQALAVYEGLGDDQNLAAAWMSVFLAWWSLEKPEQALAALERSKEARARTGNLRTDASLFMNLGLCYLSLARTREAVIAYEQAVALSREAGNTANEVWSLTNLAVALRRLGQADTSLALYRQALALCDSLPDQSLRARSLHNLADGLLEAGTVGRAIDTLNEALALERKLGDPIAEAKTLQGLGEAYCRLGNAELGQQNFRQALEIFLKLDDKEGLMGAFKSAGIAYLEEQRPGWNIGMAGGFLEQALQLATELGNRREEGIIRARLSTVYLAMGNLKEANKEIDLALERLERAGDQLEEAQALLALSDIRLNEEREEEAIAALEAALHIFETQHLGLYRGRTLTHLAQALARAGRREEALRRVDEALAALHSLEASIRDPYLESAHFVAVADTLELAIRLRVVPGLERSEAALAETFELGEQARATSYHRWLALTQDRSRLEVPPHIRAQADAAREATQYARRLLQAGSPLLEEDATLLAWLTAIPLTPETQAWRTEVETGAVKDRHALRLAYAEYCEKASLEAEQAVDSASRDALLLAMPRAELREIQQALPAETLMLAYVTGQETSFMWAVSSREVRLIQLAGSDFSAEVEAFRARLWAPESSTAELLQLAHTLYESLGVEAALELFPRAKRLVVVPDGDLGLIPFEALASRIELQRLAGEPDSPWLGYSFPITYAFSASTWLNFQRRGPTKPLSGPMLLVADPVYELDDPKIGLSYTRTAQNGGETELAWARLAYTELEAEAILQRRRFLHSEDVVLRRQDATVPAVMAQPLETFSLLHFATHAHSSAQCPECSAIVLSFPSGVEEGRAPPADDGYLSLAELLTMKTRADLVVLSGCQTGEGRQRRGEGVESLARGFLLTGSRSVMASLWKVNDQSTAVFMGRFYQELRRHAAEDALFQTRRAFMAGRFHSSVRTAGGQQVTFSHPFYWATFVLLEGGGH